MIKNISNNNCGIYCWTNKINGRKYIGQSINLKKRKSHFTCFNSPYGGIYIDRARTKYNKKEYWEYKVLEYCNEEELNEKEIYYIDLYNTFNEIKGYNLSEGGNGSRGYKLTEEHTKKIREVTIKPIYQIDTKTLEIINEFESITEATIYIKGSNCCITNCCNGKQKTAYGYYWVRKEDYENGIRPIIKKETKKVLQIDRYTLKIIREWDSSSQASKQMGFIKQHIIACCKGKMKTANNYIWCYKEDYENRKDNLKFKNGNFTEVYQLDLVTNRIIRKWDSIKEAEKETKCKSIRSCCNGYIKQSGGFKWCYVDNPKKANYIEHLKGTKIIQYDLKGNLVQEWNKIIDAAKFYNINESGIRGVCKNKLKTYKGFIWRYAI